MVKSIDFFYRFVSSGQFGYYVFPQHLQLNLLTDLRLDLSAQRRFRPQKMFAPREPNCSQITPQEDDTFWITWFDKYF